MTSASSFQMLRGAVIIFTGLFSVAFLGRRLALSQWLGILATIAGLVVVGLADLLSKHDDQHKLSEVITGAMRAGDAGAARPLLSSVSQGTQHSQQTSANSSLCQALGEGVWGTSGLGHTSALEVPDRAQKGTHTMRKG